VERRRGENEARFRALNEVLERQSLRRPNTDLAFEIVCECDDEACAQPLRVTYRTYEAVRHEPTMFIVAPGHDRPEIEQVTSRRSSYDIVEKFGDAALTALVSDPRA
jgi:hypothetical protein